MSRTTRSTKAAKTTSAKVATPKPRRTSVRKDYNKLSLALHKKLKGKLSVETKHPLKTKDDWSMMYTPGVAAVSAHLAQNPKDAAKYSVKGNSVAIVSDGSAVLGLGNIGPLGALPVMEGKAAILKAVAGVDAWPIVLNTQNVDEVVAAVKAIAPTFGAINLEDFAAPQCFEIEERLKAELSIPVMHDDQHGTAIVVLAGLMNASKVVQKKLEDMQVVIVGAGAAGTAIAFLLAAAGVRDIIVTDRKGIIHEGRSGLTAHKKRLAVVTNPRHEKGDVLTAVQGADVLVGVSGPGTIAKAHIEAMAENAIVFALANPIPEIKPEDAKQAGAAVVATGRSDYPNQVNNALAFPGIFRGVLDRGVTAITEEMKLAVAKKIAGLVKKPTADEIIPPVTHPQLVKTVASAVR